MWMFADITFERSLIYSYKTNHLFSFSILVSIGTLLRLYILHHAAVFTVAKWQLERFQRVTSFLFFSPPFYLLLLTHVSEYF